MTKKRVKFVDGGHSEAISQVAVLFPLKGSTPGISQAQDQQTPAGVGHRRASPMMTAAYQLRNCPGTDISTRRWLGYFEIVIRKRLGSFGWTWS